MNIGCLVSSITIKQPSILSLSFPQGQASSLEAVGGGRGGRLVSGRGHPRGGGRAGHRQCRRQLRVGGPRQQDRRLRLRLNDAC